MQHLTTIHSTSRVGTQKPTKQFPPDTICIKKYNLNHTQAVPDFAGKRDAGVQLGCLKAFSTYIVRFKVHVFLYVQCISLLIHQCFKDMDL